MADKAMFGAGCFWCVEDDFRKIEGVTEVTSGYSGGEKPNPTYEEVCTGQTGHAEVVQVQYDSERTDFEALVRTFFNMHDPTTLNRQGPDVGTQYRSAIFYETNAQKKVAEQIKDELNRSGKYSSPIVTEISPAGPFYKAEEYHQQYYCKIRERQA
jgi:peptide-methionine (S)-S-oxide reductase